MAGLIVRYEGGGGIAGRSPWLSGWLRRAELRGFGHFEGEGRGSARLKLGLSSEPKPLSAHRFFTRQVAGAASQGAPKPLTLKASERDALRSEARRDGEEWYRRSRFRWSARQ